MSTAPVLSPVPLPTGPPTSLLSLLAGPFAERVAGVWPAPHAAFLTAAAERRHLIFLALHRSASDRPPPSNDLLEGRLRDGVRTVVPDAPDGLGRALGKLGETAWAGEDYDALIRLLRLSGPAKGLRHAARISAEEVRGLARLPAPTLEARSGRVVLTSAQADLLAEVYSVVVRRRGEATAQAVGRRWGQAASTRRLFEGAIDALHDEPSSPPFPGSSRLRPLTSKAAIRIAAKRYRNCLAGQLGPAASGASAFYEWAGPPGAVVELHCDPVLGWRLEQARIVDNEAVSADTQAALTAELRGWGVHVGRTSWQLEYALGSAHRTGFRFGAEAEAIGELYGD